MKSFTTFFVAVLAVLPYVSAHGFVSSVVIDGKTYEGNTPNQAEKPSPVRLINDVSPVKGANNPAINCGPNAQKAQVVAPVNPGSQMSFFWHSGDDSASNWPHKVGPVITYMAECTGTTCDKFDAANAQWFKIHEVGQHPNGTWFQEDLFNRRSITVPVPKNLKAGDYLVRHEIIALHIAESMGGAEFYPSCTQVKLGGNGSGTVQDTVKFPGAYSDTDRGILVNVFGSTDPYVFPGPPVAKLISASGALSNSNGTADNGTAASSSASAPATSASASKKSCHTMRDENGIKRRYSRVMRSLLPAHI